MRTSRFSEEQILRVLQEQAAGGDGGGLPPARHQRVDVLPLEEQVRRHGGRRDEARRASRCRTVAESFVGRLRDECLNEHWFTGLADARRTVEEWRRDYNAVRPHSSLGYRTPIEARRTWTRQAATLPIQAGLSQ